VAAPIRLKLARRKIIAAPGWRLFLPIQKDGAVSGSAPRLSLTKLYEQRASECALAAEGTDRPKDRERLLKWADDWRAAAREGLMPQRMGSRAA
jgi:hypothetical protein